MSEQSIGQGRTRFPLRIAGWGLALAMFLAPLIAMQFSGGVAWTSIDFAIFGLMLLAAGFAIETAVRAIRKGSTRVLAVVVVVGAFLWLWAELAVGVFTSWGS